jgi:ankyrin repeat protein
MVADKCDVNVSIDGVRPLLVAIEKDHRALASILLDAGAALQQPSPTLLEIAVARGSANVAELFISQGMEVTTQHILDAACHGHRSLLALLLRRFKPQGGMTILHLLPSVTQPNKNALHRDAIDRIVDARCPPIGALDCDLQTPLHRATEAGNAYVLSALLTAGADVNAAGSAGGRSALMVASEKGDLAAMKALMDAGPALRIDAQDAIGFTALHVATRASTLPAVEALLQARADVNAADIRGATPLFYASSAAIASALLDAGADINHRDKQGDTTVLCTSNCEVMTALINRNADLSARSETGRTVLMRAVENRNMELFQLLLATFGTAALVNEQDYGGVVALSIAVCQNHLSFVTALLAAGADPNIPDDDGLTPLMLARDAEIARRLIDRRADINAHAQDGYTPILFASSHDSIDASLIELLLDCGADATASHDDGHNSLMLAASEDRVDIMTLLLRAPDVPAGWVDTQRDDGRTALIMASAAGSTAAVEALIAAGADVHLATTTGFTALHQADNVDIAGLLWNAGARDAFANDGSNALISACSRNKPSIVEFLMQHGSDGNVVYCNKTPLMQAASFGYLDVLRVLLAADPPVDVNELNNEWCTAIIFATDKNHASAVKLLLAHGASADITIYNGLTTLMLAAGSGYLDVVKELLQAQSPTLLNAQTGDGRTALFVAVRGNKPLVVSALLAAGADPNIPTHDGTTPLSEVLDVETAQRLLDCGADVNARLPGGMTALLRAVYRNMDLSFISLLLERGADANASCGNGSSCLVLAANSNLVDILKLLLAADPPPDVNHQHRDGFTALYFAVMRNHIMAVESLLDAGANPSIASSNGVIPLMRCPCPRSVTMLVEAAPDLVNHTCNKGRRALAYMDSPATIQELLTSSKRHNAQIDVNHKDFNGDTALHMVLVKRLGLSAVQLLLKEGAEVFGVGYGGTTVLMKPFLSDVDYISEEYGNRAQHTGTSDLIISECLRAIIDHALARDGTATSAPGDCDMINADNMVEDVCGLEEYAAKRQKR